MPELNIEQFSATVSPGNIGQSSSNKTSLDAIYGFDVKDKTIVQKTSLLDSTTKHDGLKPSLGEPIFQMVAHMPPAAYHAIEKAPVIEYVAHHFPSSNITPDFKARIESEFDEFQRILYQDHLPHQGQWLGWSEATTHAEMEGSATALLIVTAWDNLLDFDDSVASKNFSDAVKILIAWGSKVKLVSLQNDLFLHL